ncbi:hypothetical protein Rhal01_03370 [Rubritalea halochordaticola]|uniref:Uncharacterized protein n=1 Tax=Rubritalea halochordaticola TaxID=714537 RepID=A0ABP9V5C4_9BACT
MGKRLNILLLIVACSNFSSHAEDKSTQFSRFQYKDPSELINKRKASLAINKRTYGPFGKNQDPNAKVAPPKTITKKPKVVEQSPELELKNVIGNLKPKVNMAGNNMAIINGQRFLKGDILKLKAKDPKTNKTQVFEVQLARATSKLLAFRNIKSGEFHYLQLGGDLNLGTAEDLEIPQGDKKGGDIDISK